MSKEYLKDLRVSDEVRSKLSALDAPTLFDLVAQAKASEKAFANYLGLTEADVRKLIKEMESHLSDAERKLLSSPVQRFPLGANLGPSPKIDK